MLSGPIAPWPSFDDEEVDAVADVLRSGRVNQWTGSEVVAFERDLAAWCSVGHAVALANGTLALEAALRACDIGPGDEVIVTPRTFVASASSVMAVGATPVFCDVDRNSGNMTVATIERVMSGRTKAILPVHLGGWPCDMPGIMAFARANGLRVIEDCAQAHGARVGGRSVGAWGDVGVWSFCQDKIMSTAGEGGAVTTSDPALWRRMWSYKDHGKDYDDVHRTNHPAGFRWLHHTVGTNWRMMEVQAKVGRIQLGRLAKWSQTRAAHAAVLRQALQPFAELVRAPVPRSSDTHAYYRFYFYIVPEALAPGWSRDRIISEATPMGLPLFQGSCSEVYRERAFDGLPGRPIAGLPVAQELGLTSLAALVHPTISKAEITHCAGILADLLRRAHR